MHESNLSTEIVLAPQKVQSNGAAAGEINLRSSRRHLRISKERAAANLEIGNNAPMSIERPFESERIHACAISGVLFLKDEKCRHQIDGVFAFGFGRVGERPRRKPGP